MDEELFSGWKLVQKLSLIIRALIEELKMKIAQLATDHEVFWFYESKF